jgi:hypothetical protein
MPWILFIGAEVAIERSTILHLTSVMQHALKRLLPAIERAILADPYRGRHWSQARPSVIHKHTRLWIHQGLWVAPREEDRSHLLCYDLAT